MFINDPIAEMEARDAEAIAADINTPLDLSTRRNEARRGGQFLLADVLDRKLAEVKPSTSDWLDKHRRLTESLMKIATQWNQVRTADLILNDSRIVGQPRGDYWTRKVEERGWLEELDRIDSAAQAHLTTATRELERSILSTMSTLDIPFERAMLFQQQATAAWPAYTAHLDTMPAPAAAQAIADRIASPISPLERRWLVENGTAYLRGRGVTGITGDQPEALLAGDARVRKALADQAAAQTLAVEIRHGVSMMKALLASPPPTGAQQSAAEVNRDLGLRIISTDASDLNKPDVAAGIIASFRDAWAAATGDEPTA